MALVHGPAATGQPTPASTPTVNPTEATPPWPEVQDALPQARRLGQDRFRTWGLDVYDASLWAAPDFRSSQFEASPLALSLVYLRRLRGAAIAERSLEEMRRPGPLTDAQAKAWLAAMTALFPDVQAQDRLTGVHTPGGPARFWLNGRSIGSVVDPAFGPRFFGIWLSPSTSAPRLRQALLQGAAA